MNPAKITWFSLSDSPLIVTVGVEKFIWTESPTAWAYR